MIPGKYYLCSYPKFGVIPAAKDLILFKNESNSTILASELNMDLHDAGNTNPTVSSIKSVQEVPESDFPLYIGWRSVNPLLFQIIKGSRV
jgi:hypothetical protein